MSTLIYNLFYFSSNPERRQTFIDEIEKLILKLTNDLICGRKLVISIPYRMSWDNCVFDNERFVLIREENKK